LDQFQCVSFHWSKTLGIQQGGAILHGDPDAGKWFRKARFDGRTEGVAPKDDQEIILGYHCYMSPEIAAEGLVRLWHLPKHNDDLPNDEYPDLSQIPLFQKLSQKSAETMVGYSTMHSSSSWLQETPGPAQSNSSASSQRRLQQNELASYGADSPWTMPVS